MDNLQICFAGTPAFAAAQLQALLDAGHTVVAVYTQPDRPSGRGKKLLPSPVKQLALASGLPVLQPASLKPGEEAEALAALKPDVMVVVAYGLILPKTILDVPRLGCLNVHASLLPRWRGAAPIERALLAGDEVSGVTIMQMDEGLDTGAMLDTEAVDILDSDNRVDLEKKLQIAGQTALIRTLDNLEARQSNATAQVDADSCYAAKLEKSEALIDWNMSAESIGRQIRAGIGRSPAYSMLGDQRLRILEGRPSTDGHLGQPGEIVDSSRDSFSICCASGLLEVTRVQLPGKNPASVKDINNARPDLFATGRMFASSQG